MKKIIGLVLFCSGIAAITRLDVTIFADFISLIFVLLTGSSLTLIEYRKNFSRNDLILSIRKNMIFAGWMGLLVGTIYILSDFDQSHLDQEAANFAVALLSVFYGYIVAYLAVFFSQESAE
ncbi:hypothetical protein [Vibrio quintilis]|uniref:Uncharacterized protein n=1 Tax=Vibrio quintilis TaxID=1117707 RepID=A0A1M7Z2B3_9VIBR|nr:hypothetical protein [Vibrio quintilis]SHO59107.1 hypothetical protein VQ7734_04884 [Vibrio quintilis]